jgi:aromatic ring hydroxylase
LYERYYSGDPVRLAGALYAMYPKDAPVARIHQMLDELEAKSHKPE